MKKTFVLAACLWTLAGCRKHSLLAPPGVVSSITYYNVSQHQEEIESFAYNGAQLTTYTSQIFDSLAQNGYETPWQMETVVYRFQYQDTGVAPTAYSIVDSLYGPGFTIQATASLETDVLRYDGQGRIISDSVTSSTDTSTCCGPIMQWAWDYSGAGIGVYYFRSHTAPLALYDSVQFNNQGDANSYYNTGAVFGSTRNPLYNPAFAGNLGPLFFDVVRSGSIAWLPFQVDLLSKTLLVSETSPVGNDYQLTMKWQIGPDGRVSGGTATDMFTPTNATDSFFGPVKINYGYR